MTRLRVERKNISISKMKKFITKRCPNLAFGENRLNMFMKNLDLKIVDFTDIPNWDNYETMYIPLFENAENIIK